MKLLIDTTELQLLLEKKRDYIGNERYSGIDVIFAGVTFLISSFYSKYPDVGILSGKYVKIFCIFLGLTFTIWGIYKMRKSMGIQYNQESLYKDIEQLNEVTHPFSIVVIKDTFNKYPNRFLLYYDERWNCKLFFNYRTVEDNEKNIISRLSNELKVKKEDIAVDFVTEQIYRKYSVSDKKDKVYDHRIYHVDIAEFSKNSMENEFEIDGKKFYWMTLNDMEKDADIREKNIELVDIVKTSIG